MPTSHDASAQKSLSRISLACGTAPAATLASWSCGCVGNAGVRACKLPTYTPTELCVCSERSTTYEMYKELARVLQASGQQQVADKRLRVEQRPCKIDTRRLCTAIDRTICYTHRDVALCVTWSTATRAEPLEANLSVKLQRCCLSFFSLFRLWRFVRPCWTKIPPSGERCWLHCDESCLRRFARAPVFARIARQYTRFVG